MVVSDAGFDGLVVRIATRGLRFETSGGDGVVTAAAGEPWDTWSPRSVARGLGGVECLSGIPGLVGATPIQNVGAYGQEVAETIRSVRVLERGVWQTRELCPRTAGSATGTATSSGNPAASWSWRSPSGCARAPRPPCATGSWPTASPAPHRRAPATLADARATVLALRAKKSMLVTPRDPNRRSVGSFFMNPILAAEEVERWPRAPATTGPDAALAGERRPGQALRRLAHRAGRGRQGPASRSGRGLQRPRVGPGPPRRRHHRRAAGAGPGNPEAVRRRFGVTLVPEPDFGRLSWNLGSG